MFLIKEIIITSVINKKLIVDLNQTLAQAKKGPPNPSTKQSTRVSKGSKYKRPSTCILVQIKKENWWRGRWHEIKTGKLWDPLHFPSTHFRVTLSPSCPSLSLPPNNPKISQCNSFPSPHSHLKPPLSTTTTTTTGTAGEEAHVFKPNGYQVGVCSNHSAAPLRFFVTEAIDFAGIVVICIILFESWVISIGRSAVASFA